MDVLFKNSHTRSKELLKEIYGYYFFGRKWLRFLEIVLALGFIIELKDVIMGNVYEPITLIGVPILFALMIYVYHTSVNTTLKRDIELHGKEVAVQITLTDESINASDSMGSETQIAYTNVKKGVLTKNTVVLFTAARMMLIFTNDGFEIGTKEDFIAFLKTKGIKIKNKKKKEKR